MFEPSFDGLPLYLSRDAKLQVAMTNNTTPAMNPKRSEITENVYRFEEVCLSLAI